MSQVKERFVVDETGSRIAVQLDIDEYQRILEAIEELESIRAFEQARSSNDEAIPFEQAIAEIESQRS